IRSRGNWAFGRQLCFFSLATGVFLLVVVHFGPRNVSLKNFEQVLLVVTFSNLLADAKYPRTNAIGTQLASEPEFGRLTPATGIDRAEAGQIGPGAIRDSVEPGNEVPAE